METVHDAVRYPHKLHTRLTVGWGAQKLSRKLVHILAGPGFILCWPLFSAEPSARFFAAAVPFLNLLRCGAVLGWAQARGAMPMTPSFWSSVRV